jgi:hypothetical protein
MSKGKRFDVETVEHNIAEQLQHWQEWWSVCLCQMGLL